MLDRPSAVPPAVPSKAPAETIRDGWARFSGRSRQLFPKRADWHGSRPARDLNAGLTVAMVALPLALGFGVSSGLGARAGLVTAVIAGILAAVFGGSRVQVSGPTGAMTVVLIPIIAQYGPSGVLVAGILAGLFLVGLGYAGAGRLIRYVPIPVIEGFTLGIAAIIALQQVPMALGTSSHRKVLPAAVDAVSGWLAQPAWAPLGITVGVAAGILVASRFLPKLPTALIAVALAAVAASVLGLDTATIGHIPSGFPAPHLPTIGFSHLQALVLPAIAIAALAALESLLSATVADGLSVGGRHDSDRELFGQGIANLVVPLFGGVPATAAIARTAVNVRAGATSRLAAALHAVALLAVMLLAAPLVARIPLPALAGVLIATAVQMVRISSLTPLLRATRSDAAVLILTAGATIALDLVTAVLVGLVSAGFFALQQVARSARLDPVPLDDGEHGDEEQSLLDEQIVAYRLDGPLFFAGAHDFLLELTQVSRVRVVILRMSRVSALDATGAAILGDTIARLEGHGTTVLMSGIKPAHERVLRTLGVYERLADERHLFASTPDAIAHARVHVANTDHAATARQTD